jgi:putative transposase
LWHRAHQSDHGLLDLWPVPQPQQWFDHVNGPQTEGELQAVRRSVIRGMPYGAAEWIERTVKALGLESTLRPRGRPRKQPEK